MVLQKVIPEQVKLYQAREEALCELRHLRQEIQDEIDIDADEADEQITEHETAAILIAMLEHKIGDIDTALLAIELGRYGICERCGLPIEQGRLAAKPYARLCILCQEEAEMLRASVSVRQDDEEQDF